MSSYEEHRQDVRDDLLVQELRRAGMRECKGCGCYYFFEGLIGGLCKNCRCDHCGTELKEIATALEICMDPECNALYSFDYKTLKKTFLMFPEEVTIHRALRMILNGKTQSTNNSHKG